MLHNSSAMIKLDGELVFEFEESAKMKMMVELVV